MTAPSVAVVIPCYNRGRYLAATLGSVFQQTLPPQEVHIIDDGSTDDSVQVIERAFAGAGPVRCFLTARENRGISATRNELCAATTTDFVAFLDSDDLYAPNRLERMLAAAPRGAPYFAFSGVDFLADPNDELLNDWQEMYHLRLGQAMAFPTAGFGLLRYNIAITASNFVISRGLFDAVGGFDERIKICQEWDFAVQSLRLVEPTFIPEPLMTYRIHSDNISHHRVASEHAWEINLAIENLCEWILQPTANPRAPTPRNWPRYFRIFAHLNATTNTGRALAARLPRELLAAASEPAATARETAAIRALVAAARSPESLQDLTRDELWLRCQEAWTELPSSGPLFGQLSWLDYDLPVAAPDPLWFEWLENFTGLNVEHQDGRPNMPVLSVIDDRHALVDEGDLRTFPGLEDLKAWLFLTVSDIMIARGGFTAFHAAGLAVAGRAILVAGPPWSGKSSWAFEAQRRGLEVLGDDQVCVDPVAGVVRPLPRPLKRRLVAEDAGQDLSLHAVRAHLDNEFIALEPRRTAGLAPVDRGYPVSGIVHLARHAGAGVKIRALQKTQAFEAVLNQTRGFPPRFFLADAAAAAKMLGRLPNICMSVGDGELAQALDLAMDLSWTNGISAAARARAVPLSAAQARAVPSSGGGPT